MSTQSANRVIFVTGPSGAGRSTAIKALEDLGFEVIDNLPLTLVDRLLGPEAAPLKHPLALGIDVRNRDFSADALIDVVDHLADTSGEHAELLYLDATPDVLLRRYSETRRRHPLAPTDMPQDGIALETDILEPIRERAETLIDTSDLTPHDLRAVLSQLYSGARDPGLAISIQSFSYKRGLPPGADTVFDMRFLRNPFWVSDLRDMDGRDAPVATYVTGDTLFTTMFSQMVDLVLTLLPAYLREGKTHLTIAFGCTGGQHRSVVVAEELANRLAKKGWRVSTRHRELERRAGISARPNRGSKP